MWRVQKVFFRISQVREIILNFSKGKAKILGICDKIVLGINRREALKLWDRLVKIYDYKCCVVVILKYSWYQWLTNTTCAWTMYKQGRFVVVPIWNGRTWCGVVVHWLHGLGEGEGFVNIMIKIICSTSWKKLKWNKSY